MDIAEKALPPDVHDDTIWQALSDNWHSHVVCMIGGNEDV
jgi:hypothetical protein